MDSDVVRAKFYDLLKSVFYVAYNFVKMSAVAFSQASVMS